MALAQSATTSGYEHIAQAGLLIKGQNAIYDNTLMKFDADVNAQRFYGVVTCRYLDDLLRQDHPILLATREGLDGSHWFVKNSSADVKNSWSRLSKMKRSEHDKRYTVLKVGNYRTNSYQH